MNRFIILVGLTISLTVLTVRAHDPNPMQLWYSKPADRWVEALPIGNGSLGGMVFGGVAKERIQLNEESVWTGHAVEREKPNSFQHLQAARQLLFDEKYSEAEALLQDKFMGKRLDTGTHTYQTLGDLLFNFSDHTDGHEYYRQLDLDSALVQVRYRTNGVSYSREVFSSYPDQILVVHFAADQPNSLNFDFEFKRPGEGSSVRISDNRITLTEHVGNGNGVQLAAILELRLDDGSLNGTENGFEISAASSVTLILTAATDYQKSEIPVSICAGRLAAVSGLSYQELRLRHISDYQNLFQRVKIDLGSDEHINLPTDERIAAVKDGGVDPQLMALYFQYGRYLLISSSRPGSLPANLQGIWAEA